MTNKLLESKTFSFTVMKTTEGFVTKDDVMAFWNRIRIDIHPEGLPLFWKEDGREIGRLKSAVLVNMQDRASVEGEAVITDSQLLNQPWLRLDQIARRSLHDNFANFEIDKGEA